MGYEVFRPPLFGFEHLGQTQPEKPRGPGLARLSRLGAPLCEVTWPSQPPPAGHIGGGGFMASLYRKMTFGELQKVPLELRCSSFHPWVPASASPQMPGDPLPVQVRCPQGVSCPPRAGFWIGDMKGKDQSFLEKLKVSEPWSASPSRTHTCVRAHAHTYPTAL